MPETSIIIRAYNEAEYIGDVLEAVTNQHYQDFEIILVDSGSTDGTLEIAEEYVDKIEFVAPQNFTFGYSCNVGCNTASGKFCVFLSAHAIPTDETWLGTMIDNLYEDEVAMTYSNQVGAETTKYPERRLFNELFPDESRRQTPPDYWANNASSAIKRSLWEEHQFDEYLTGHEDIEWAKHFMNQGYVVKYEADACIYHIHDETWEQVYHRFEREAIADVEIGIKDPSDRWKEYVQIPKDIVKDAVAAARNNKISRKTVTNIIRFRYNQHMGTVSGLLSESDLEEDRYKYYYDGTNESLYIDRTGSISVTQDNRPDVKPNDVLIRTEYVGIDPQIHTVSNNYSESIIPSGSYVGEVIQVGANVTSVDVGDTVIGETRFHCGVCDECQEENYRSCKNPTLLGVDTETGAYSRYVSVPSGYVYSLADGIDQYKGVLAQTVTAIENVLDWVDNGEENSVNCLIIGNTAKAKLATQIVDVRLDGVVTNISEDTFMDNGRESITQYNILIEGFGSTEIARQCVKLSSDKSTIILLGSQYEGFSLTSNDIRNKQILVPEAEDISGISNHIEMLREIDHKSVLNGTYELSEFKQACNHAVNRQAIPVIEMDTDTG